jgi:hypothetical protein
MSRLIRALGRRAGRLVPAARREWVEAVWAETPDVPSGLRRLAWRAGGVRLMAREALMRRTIGSAMLFAAAATAAAFAAWPSSSANVETPVDRVHVITMVAVLAGLPLLVRPFLGPVSDSRAARLLRVGAYVALLALIPGQTAVDQFDNTRPRGGADLRVYLLVGPVHPRPQWGGEILILVVMTLYVAAILWMTSRRSGVAPATLAVGTVAGIALGVVMYAVAPLGLSKEATNPWLPGSDIDPLMLVAWLLVLCGPAAAAIAADRRCRASASSLPPVGPRIRQFIAAGLLTSLVGALLVAVLGTSTIVVMLKTAWLRNWLYHGQHLLYGVQKLSSDLKTLPVIAYSHQITGSTDAGVFIAICLIFPLIALLPTGFGVLGIWDGAATSGDTRGPGSGGPPGPEPTADPPAGIRLADTDTGAGVAAARLRVLAEDSPVSAAPALPRPG